MEDKTENAQDIAAFEAIFQQWREKNPGGRFSDFSAERLIRHLTLGRSHASLGNNLKSGEDWKVQGRGPYDALVRFFTESTDHKSLPTDFGVCDYGCGTLRLGIHLMEHLERGKYCGLDLAEPLIDFGRNECRDLIIEKAPVIGTFAKTLPAAVEMGFDLIFSFNVACHVHPQEMDEYIDNIQKLASKPGCITILHFLTHTEATNEAIRYQRSGWAWPRELIKERFSRLQSINDIHFKDSPRGGYTLPSYYLVFKTP